MMKPCLFPIYIVDLHGSSVVASILYKSAFMDQKISDKASAFIKVSFYSRH